MLTTFILSLQESTLIAASVTMTRAIFNPYRVDEEKEEKEDGAVAEELISSFLFLILTHWKKADGISEDWNRSD